MKILYYDCFAGISGDMNLGALIDLGVDSAFLQTEMARLNIPGFHLDIRKDQRRGISGTKADVVIENQENEKHRHLRHIEEIIRASSLPEKVKVLSLKIFNEVAVAEGKVHQVPKEHVHFHEVGALDSIADIVGAAICLDYLKVDKIYSSPVQLGGGTVKCAHGIMPVPAPATAEILKNIPIRSGLVNYEATTPTGAAILAATVDEFTEVNSFRILKTGYGIGTRDTEVPNVLRVFLCEEAGSGHADLQTAEAVVLECNIDDMNPEHYDFILDQLFQAGASDAWLTPVIMKKSRPANVLSVLCAGHLTSQMKTVIFTNSTSIGIREYRVKKNMLRRELVTLNTSFGPVQVKQSYYNGRLVTSKPELEDIRRLALANGVSLQEIEKAVFKTINQQV
ncbi:MAG: nickel pincer cofactor biosynthesis protein LarC [Prolixibacteraceae bacterium]